MHSIGVCHRDIKPENIMFTSKNSKQNFHVKLIDFGLSSFVNVSDMLYKRCGTPGYVAPEIISLQEGETYTDKCDVFSAGIIMYTLL